MPGGVVVEMTSKEEALWRGMQRIVDQQKKLEGGFGKVEQKGKTAGKQIDRSFSGKDLQKYIGLLTGAGGLAGAIATVTRSHETWLTNIREIMTEAHKAANEYVALAALQEGGTKAERVRQATTLAASFGITQRGEAYNTIQALQSALGGDWGKGVAASRAVFQATQLGIPLDFARELEVLGAAQGMRPGESLRKAYAAGQASARDPAVLARAAPGLTFWQDKALGYAAAGVLAGGVRPEQLETYVKAGGIGLSQVSAKDFQETLRGLGVAEADRFTKLRALREAGMDTPEKLAAAGLAEMRQQQAVATLVKNLDEVYRIRGEIERRAKPGLLYRERMAVESEIPSARLQREIDTLRAMMAEEKAFGPRAMPALEEERRQLIRGLAFQRRGFEQGFLGRDFIDEQGRVHDFSMMRARIFDALGLRNVQDLFTTMFTGEGFDRPGRPEGMPGTLPGIMQEVERITQNLDETAAALNRAGQNLESASNNLNGGHTMVKPGEDK